MINLTESLLTVHRDHRGGSLVLRLNGQVDILSAPALKAEFDAALAELTGSTVLVADLTGLTFMGSVGIAELVRIQEHTESRDQRFYVVAPPFIRRILDLTGLSETLELLPSADDVPA